MVKSKFDNIEVDVADRNKDNSRNNVTDLDNLPMEKQEIVRFGQDTKHKTQKVLSILDDVYC